MAKPIFANVNNIMEDSAIRRQATRVFKKSSPNGKVDLFLLKGYVVIQTDLLQITVYLGKRDFVDHISHVDPIGNAFKISIYVIHKIHFRWCGFNRARLCEGS